MRKSRLTPTQRKKSRKPVSAQEINLQEVIPADFPELQLLVWNRNPMTAISGAEALAIYKRQWRFVSTDKLNESETALIKALAEKFGNGHFAPLK
jgi:hypothetical protein